MRFLKSLKTCWAEPSIIVIATLIVCVVAFSQGCGKGGARVSNAGQYQQAKAAQNSTGEGQIQELPDAKLSNDALELPTLNFGNQTEGGESSSSTGATESATATGDSALGAADRDPAVGGRDLVNADDDGCLPRRNLGALTLVSVDSDRTAAAGLQIKESQHLQLIFEPGSEDLVKDFSEVFDLAVDQWVSFFSADPKRFKDWKVTCFYIVDLEKFRAAGLVPDAKRLPGGTLPPGGWEFGNQIWVNQHPGNYYNRHMLLHEGTHAFCFYNFGTLGPPWLAEGLAEHLAVHSWRDGKLTLADRVTDKNELEYWGRVRIIQDAWFDGVPKSLGQVMSFPPAAFPATESYAWSWAAVMMFDRHPKLHDAFHRTLSELNQLSPEKWNRKFLESQSLDTKQLKSQWEVLCSEMTYGYDVNRGSISWSTEPASDASEFNVAIDADGAWHQTQYMLSAGKWKIDAEGMFQIAKSDDESLISTAEGVSYEYFHGARIGQLEMATETGQGFFETSSVLTSPILVGQEDAIRLSEAGRLYLRINDHPSFLDDNEGQVIVKFSRLED